MRELRPRAEVEIETSLGAVLGAQAGPGTVGLFRFADPDAAPWLAKGRLRVGPADRRRRR